MTDHIEIAARLGPGVWSMACLGHPTNFALSPAGKIHGAWCSKVAGRDVLDLPELADAIVAGAPIAGCCQPCPVNWLRTHRRALQAALDVIDERASDRQDLQ